MYYKDILILRIQNIYSNTVTWPIRISTGCTSSIWSTWDILVPWTWSATTACPRAWNSPIFVIYFSLFRLIWKFRFTIFESLRSFSLNAMRLCFQTVSWYWNARSRSPVDRPVKYYWIILLTAFSLTNRASWESPRFLPIPDTWSLSTNKTPVSLSWCRRYYVIHFAFFHFLYNHVKNKIPLNNNEILKITSKRLYRLKNWSICINNIYIAYIPASGLKFAFDVKTTLNISDIAFYPSQTTHSYDIYASSTDKEDILFLDLTTGEIILVDLFQLNILKTFCVLFKYTFFF